MSTPTTIDLAIPEDVTAEVQRLSAQVEFDTFRENVADHFSDATTVEICLQEDPDEEDRNRVVFHVTVPRIISQEELRTRENNFDADLAQRRPHIAWPICTLSVWYAKE